MRNEAAQPIVRLLLDHADAGKPWMAPDLADGADFPAAVYADGQHLALERERLFGRLPQVVALSADLPESGSFVTRDQFRIPLLLSRGRDGRVRALANVCAHRGGQVVADERGCRRRHACSYHAWTYDEAGTLVAVPDKGSFPTVAVPGPGLRSVPVVESQGLIWVVPTVSSEDAIDLPPPDLGPIGEDFDHYDVASHQHWRSHRFDLALNWKLVIDTFLEPYHFASLHRDTVGPIFFPNVCHAQRHGRHLREVIPRRSLAELARTAPETWDVVPHSAIVYVLFPSTVFVMQIDHIETWRVWPHPHDPGRSFCDLDFYVPNAPETESARRHWENNWRLTIDTVEHEDFHAMAGVQRGVASGALDRVRFGANEPALIMFHQALEEAMAEGR
jgi:nitrite reductase/ring-hydroxylating ferredoxin subunit